MKQENITLFGGKEVKTKHSVFSRNGITTINISYYIGLSSRDAEVFIDPAKREYSVDTIRHGSWIIGDQTEAKYILELFKNSTSKELNNYYKQLSRFKFGMED